MEYYQRILRYAALLWVKRLKDGRSKLIGFIVQTTILFAVLYYFPLFGPLLDEAGTVGATVIAIIASSCLLFLYDLWRSPVLIDQYQREDLSRAIQLAQEVLASESKLRTLGELHSEGKAILDTQLSQSELTSAFADWTARCETFIGENFEFSRLHAYRIAGGLRSFDPGRRDGLEKMRDLFEGKLRALDSIISNGNFAIMPSLQMKTFLDNAGHPVYRFLLPGHKPKP